MKETIQKHSKHKYIYYQNTHTLQNPYIHKPTRYKTRTYPHPHITKQVKITTVHDTHQIK
jgi:hypothetical protein